MSGESDDLDKLLGSIADGDSIDWDELERVAPDEESRRLIRQLRLVAEVAEVHRSHVDEAVDDDQAVTVPVVPGDGWPPPRIPHVGGGPAAGDGGAWGHLLLVRKIGEGSYGEVYHAHDTWLDHPVALKLLKPEAEKRVHPSDLLHEARKLARVRHTNVVSVHGADRHNGRVGFWMDFIDGETLASRVAKGRLSAGEAVSVGQEVCRALAAVHKANIIHRDVKAQNVMRAHDGGRIILMDFGAGQFVDDTSLGKRAQGTPLYLAPELLNGHDATVQSDIYAVGVLLYHLVTGRFPVEAGSPTELADKHARGDRRRLRDERPDLPESFIAIVERAINPDPALRYASAGEMEAKLSGEPSSQPVPVPPEPPRLVLGDYAKRAAAALVIALTFTGALGFIAVRFFEVVLRVEPDFHSGPLAIFTVGAQALLSFVIFGSFGAAVLGALAGLRLLLSRFISRPWNRLAAFSGSMDPVMSATLVFLLGAVSWVGLNLWYRDLFGALYALRPESSANADLAILDPARNQGGTNHLLVSTYLSMLLGLAAWRWFPELERRTTEASTIRFLKWGTAALAFIVVAWAVMPHLRYISHH